MLESKKEKRYNVILITIDSLRADYLGLYNPSIWNENISPNLDAWAKEGIVFSAC